MSKTLSERIKEFLSSIKPEKITRDFEELCEEKLRALEKEAVAIREAKLFNRGYIASSTISLNLIQELQAENQALLAKNEELQAENKSWQEMVDSVNQTNRAMGNMLNKLEGKVEELEGNEWQPIESAPKDGTIILLLEDHSGEVNTGYWGLEENIFSGTENKWFSNGCIDNVLTFPNITHWMPLPELPTKIKGE